MQIHLCTWGSSVDSRQLTCELMVKMNSNYDMANYGARIQLALTPSVLFVFSQKASHDTIQLIDK